MYYECFTVEDGAQGEEATLHDWAAVAEWADKQVAACRREQVECRVYIIQHYHTEQVTDCQCVQYLTDHRPYQTTEIPSKGSRLGSRPSPLSR